MITAPMNVIRTRSETTVIDGTMTFGGTDEDGGSVPSVGMIQFLPPSLAKPWRTKREAEWDYKLRQI